jgi:hypothetical protein
LLLAAPADCSGGLTASKTQGLRWCLPFISFPDAIDGSDTIGNTC